MNLSLLIISKNYWGANMSEKTANRVKQVFSKITDDDKIDYLMGNCVNINTIKKKLEDWVSSKYKTSKIMFIYINGHGNQIRDNNGEESDNLDELLQLPDGNILDDEFTETINKCINIDRGNKYINLEDKNGKPIVFLISDHCSSGSMLDKRNDLKYNWITIGSSLDNQDSLMTGDGNVMTIFLLDIMDDLIKNNKIKDITTDELFNELKKTMLESFVGEIQIPTLNVSSEEMRNIKPFGCYF